MNKCKKCGTEFEGEFCPECGEPWLPEDEKVCPHCKAVLKATAKFCSECGYSFEKNSAPKPGVPKPAPAHAGSKLLVAYKIASFLPEALFLLFGVLAFIFLAAPATKVTSAGLFLGVMDVGSGYHVVSLSGVDGLRGPAIGLIVFAVLGLPFALRCALPAWRKGKSTPLSFGAFAFYLADLIIASVMIANTASLDEGLGVLSAGACPVCFFVFSILFAAGHAASIVACNILNETPEVKAAKAAKEEAEKARRAEFYATHKAPVMKTPHFKKNSVIYKYEKRYYDEGKEKTPSAALVFFDMHKVVLGVAAVVLIIAIVLMATLIPYFNNKFRMGVVEKISLGDSKEQVADILGEPYGEDRTSNDWFYYDGDLLSYVEKAQDLAQKQEEAIMQGNLTRAEQLAQEAKTLQEQMNSKAFKCIEITFADEKVESVLFDTRYSFEPKAKEPKEYELLKTVLAGYYEDRTVTPTKYQAVEGANTAAPYEVRFTDGSYYKTYVKNGTMEITSTDGWYSYSPQYKFSWNDKYGNYSEKISNDKAVNIGTVDEDGAWNANAQGIKKLKLSKVVLPDSVTSIKDLSLSSYEKLTYNQYGNALYVGSSVNPYLVLVMAENKAITECQIHAGTKIIYDAAFQNCTQLTGISIPNGIISIGKDAFSGCSGLTSINIPGGVTKIEKDTFGCSGLTGINIPDSVLEIGEYAFYDCSGLTGAIIGSGVTSIRDEAFYGCSGLTSIEIPDSVTRIGDLAFSGCSGLMRITIPDSVTEIGYQAFYHCSGLTSVTIGDGVKSIREYAFQDCSGLTSITIPNGVISIGYGAFYSCSGLTDIQFEGTVEAWQSIEKGGNWDWNIGNYTVTCTDGTVDKEGNVTYFGE